MIIVLNYIIIIGIIILLVGIIYGLVWNNSFQHFIQKDNIVFDNITINSSKSINSTFLVSDTNNLLSLIVNFHSYNILKGEILDPNGIAISQKTLQIIIFFHLNQN